MYFQKKEYLNLLLLVEIKFIYGHLQKIMLWNILMFFYLKILILMN